MIIVSLYGEITESGLQVDLDAIYNLYPLISVTLMC
jgi:hypothetical protein